jgi:hypothetical protein
MKQVYPMPQKHESCPLWAPLFPQFYPHCQKSVFSPFLPAPQRPAHPYKPHPPVPQHPDAPHPQPPKPHPPSPGAGQRPGGSHSGFPGGWGFGGGFGRK